MATESLQQQTISPAVSIKNLRWLLIIIGSIVIIGITGWLVVHINNFALDDPIFVDSTLGELAIWMTDQAEDDNPPSLLGQFAQTRRDQVGIDSFSANTLLKDMRKILLTVSAIVAIGAIISIAGLFLKLRRHRIGLTIVLLGLDTLIFLIPPTSGDQTVTLVLVGIIIMSLILLLSRSHVERIIGFLVVLSMFFVIWEVAKGFADKVDYQLTASVADWEYETYDDLDNAIIGLQNGEFDVLMADRRDMRDLIPPYPLEDEILEDFIYSELRFVNDFTRGDSQFGLTISPALPGRVGLTVLADVAPTIESIDQLEGLRIGVVGDAFAEEEFLQIERKLIILDMKILNNLNLPHLQSIAEALLQPARRNGPFLLIRILGDAALYTWTEAVLGFMFGATLGFALGSIFAHVQLLQRSLLPYVIASQTIPIIALAPMIVIWLRDTHPLLPVAVISAYLTFFPVTVNTLRGLQSPQPIAIDLMKSYAASKWEIMWKLRFPSALPFIFTALKVSATASVVGAIIGELPSGIRSGLGRAILDFSSDYSLISTPKLWAAILIASGVGIAFFLIVTLIEMLVLRGQSEPNQ